MPRLRVLVLYDEYSIHVNTTRDYLEAYSRYSDHDVYYVSGVRNAQCPYTLDAFDAVFLHYSVRLCLEDHISPNFAARLKEFQGLKVLFIQDEYDTTSRTCQWMEDLGLDVVFTCVPEEYRDRVYPTARFPHVQFVHTLTGFVPAETPKEFSPRKMQDREFIIGYRGRPLGFWYGDLAREKLMIGVKMRELCRERNVHVDIEWDEDKRIYGQAWDDFLCNCRATLGTESGSNVFDFDGSIKRKVLKELDRNPDATYEEVHAKHIAEHDGYVRMNQISPKIFESIVHGTALILFEGQYSDVVQPDRHYIPLKKDFSNVDDVIAKLNDDQYMEELTSRAFEEIIASEEYTYPKFVELIFNTVTAHPKMQTAVAAKHNSEIVEFAVPAICASKSNPSIFGFSYNAAPPSRRLLRPEDIQQCQSLLLQSMDYVSIRPVVRGRMGLWWQRQQGWRKMLLAPFFLPLWFLARHTVLRQPGDRTLKEASLDAAKRIYSYSPIRPFRIARRCWRFVRPTVRWCWRRVRPAFSWMKAATQSAFRKLYWGTRRILRPVKRTFFPPQHGGTASR